MVELQRRLKQIKFYKGRMNGIFDGATAQSVMNFQKSVGLKSDGIVRDELWDRMGEDVRVSAGPDPASPPTGKIKLVVDVDKLTLTVYSDYKAYKTYPIAIGKWTTPTQIGEFAVIDKGYNPGGPFGSRWIGLNVPWGNYGIHGTNRPWSIGWAASAGCIRMFNEHVEELFDWISIGTRVIIVGEDLSADVLRTLRPGHTGKDVQYVQYRLREAGFDPGPLDGWFGPAMGRAVRLLQQFYGLPETGVVGTNELYVIRIEK